MRQSEVIRPTMSGPHAKGGDVGAYFRSESTADGSRKTGVGLSKTRAGPAPLSSNPMHRTNSDKRNISVGILMSDFVALEMDNGN